MVVAHVVGEAPAAFALAALCGLGLDVEGSPGDLAFGDDGVGEVDLGYAEEFGKDAVVALEDGVGVGGEGVEPADDDLNLGGAIADLLRGARLFEDLEDFFTEGEQVLPVFFDLLDAAGDDVGDVGEEGEVDAGFALFDFGKELPDLVGGEAEDGGDEAGESFGDAPECGLRAAAAGVVGSEGVEAVLQHVEIERAEVGVYVFVERLVGAVELEVVVGLADFGVELGGAGEDELVERLHRRKRDGVRRWVEVVEVAEEEAKSVAQLAVVVADALHEVFAGGYVFAKVDGGDPETDDLAAEALGDVDRVDAISERSWRRRGLVRRGSSRWWRPSCTGPGCARRLR